MHRLAPSANPQHLNDDDKKEQYSETKLIEKLVSIIRENITHPPIWMTDEEKKKFNNTTILIANQIKQEKKGNKLTPKQAYAKAEELALESSQIRASRSKEEMLNPYSWLDSWLKSPIGVGVTATFVVFIVGASLPSSLALIGGGGVGALLYDKFNQSSGSSFSTRYTAAFYSRQQDRPFATVEDEVKRITTRNSARH